MRINDSASMNVSNNFSQINALRASLERKLGSGERINSSKDDAAGLAISEAMRGQTSVLSQQRTNAQDSLSFANAQAGAMSEINNNLNQMQQLSEQSNNVFMGATEQAVISNEMNNLATNISDTVNNSQINGINLFQTSGDMGFSGADIANVTSLSGASSMADIRSAADSVATMNAQAGSRSNAAEANVRNISTQVENLTAAESRIRDADMASTSAQYAGARILSNSSGAMLAQANMNSQLVAGLLR